ncbi:hypothetical protein HNR60_001861 [Rhodopseudomonas rhenobacensis]|uniref:Uncharacterized protein n=1 Tax=Rhodopseudomonas rhenobacensis TaxID=87461 RepID=A0A7W7Z364_9BRAD|nr:hypothetical protein [Rhodopseudomonas rhenobacensis]MBB5047109.1 hypothetical protein [Rhodopseudomonas rhenobacensis]
MRRATAAKTKSADPRHPCPVCDTPTILAEVAPHPLHANFDVHGYLCERCGPVKCLVVLRVPPSCRVM